MVNQKLPDLCVVFLHVVVVAVVVTVAVVVVTSVCSSC